MKNLKFFVMALLCLHVSLCSMAQQDTARLVYNPDLSYTQNMDNAFANVSKQYITTGIWYNRVAPMSNLNLMVSNSIVSPSLFWQAYHEMYLASLDNSRLMDITQLQLFTAYYKQYDTLSLGIFNCNFNMLKDSMREADSMLVVKDGKYFNGPNIANAFNIKLATFATLLCERLEPGKKYIVNIGNIMLENNDNKVQDVSITFKKTRGGDPIKLHHTTALCINEEGIYDVQISIKMVDGELLDYWQEVEVGFGNSQRLASQLNGTNCGMQPYQPATPNTVLPNSTIEASIPFNGIRGQAQVQVYFRTNGLTPTSPCPTTINKPIILLDGIDNQGEHNAAWIYAEKLIYRNPAQSNTTDTFRQIGDSLRMMGYDLVIFNPSIQTITTPPLLPFALDGGDDLIERNAMTLVQLIQDLKNDMTVQGINPEIAICGPSMGGLVSRYALAFMEQQLAATNNQIWNHKCRLWASLDSPHEGANIPIGLQQYIKSLGQIGSAAAVANYNGNLCAPASRQLLIHQTDHDSNSSVCNLLFDNTSPERIGWMNTLATFGYPQNLRKIALSNGSSQGGNFYTPGSNMLGLQAGNTQLLQLRFMSKFLPNTGNSFTSFNSNADFLAGISFNWFPNWYTILSITPVIHNTVFANCISTNTSVFGAIDACPGSIYDVQTTITSSITNGVTSGIANLLPAMNTANNNFNNSLNITLNSVAASLGIASSFNLSLFGSNQLANINNRAQLFALSQISFLGATKGISFIPTVSSLGLINHNFNWALPLANNLVCNNLIPFDNYYVPNQNEEHVSFTQESWRWLKAELEKGHQGTDCISFCGVNKINGKDFLCRTTSEVYSLNAQIILGSTTGTITTWTCSNGLTIVPLIGNKNQQATVTAKATASNSE